MTEDSVYQEEILYILETFPYCINKEGPTKLLDYLYLGGYKDAMDISLLKQLGITHVLNCAAYRKTDRSPYDRDSGILHYKQFYADDNESYNMLQHFNDAKTFLDHAKASGGRALVHCAMGINRGGAICAAYIMADQEMDLLETVRIIKQKRCTVLSNRGFQRQLVTFARKRGLLPGTGCKWKSRS